MSPLTQHGERVTRRLAAQRVRAAGRSRRADAGTVAEMARSLIRDAHEAGVAAQRREGGAPRTDRVLQRGQARVPQPASARSSARLTLPDAVLGSSATNSTMRGYL
jgi:hypothetical protein